MAMIDPLACERCGRRLESVDAISVIEGVCGICRNTAQSLVQPKRADELLAQRSVSRDTDDFLSDLPRIEAWKPSPMPAEPWLVEGTDETDESETHSSIRDDWFEDLVPAPSRSEPSPRASTGTRAEKKAIAQKDPAPKPLIPPGPFSPSRRSKGGPRDPVESVSEIFSLDNIPPSELPGTLDAGEGATSKIDIHRFKPPAVEYTPAAPRRRRRRKALMVGVLSGIVLTAAAGWVATDESMRERVLAYVDRLREPPVVVTQPDLIEMTVLVDPAGADVKIDGISAGPTDETGRVRLTLDPLRIEDRVLEVSAPGYHTITQALADFRGVDEAVLRLTRRPFEAEIVTDPQGAEVWLDGKLVGTAPLRVTVDPEAGARMTARKAGYKELTKNLESPGDGELLRLRLPMEPAGVILAVKTEPVPAKIWINDRPFGSAPIGIDLDYQFLGKDVEVVARAEGYDDARMTIAMPKVGGDEMAASIVLERTMARLNVHTDPPGGRVVLSGHDYGIAPVLVEFDPTETGKQVVIDTSLNGQYFGRQSVTIPPAGGPRECVIPMAFSEQRVVFVIAASRRSQADRYLLADALAARVERLDDTQRFAVLAATDDGIEAWPYEVAFETATSEQKVRAFDMVRSIRSADTIDLGGLLAAALELDPTTVWLFAEAADRPALESFAKSVDGKDVTVNLVTAKSALDDTWLDGFAARHRGVFQTLDEAIAATGNAAD